MTPLDARSFAAVIFDLDGTLVDSAAALVAAWTQWALRFGVTAEQLTGFDGMPTADIVATLIGDDRRVDALTAIHELEESRLDGIAPLPGARRALAELPGDRTAVATSGTRSVATARLRAAGLTPPAVVVTFDDVEAGKPAPEAFLLAADRLGVNAAQCLVVEDAPQGLLGARRAGCATLAVSTTTPPERLSADLVVGSLADIRWRVTPQGIGLARCSPSAT